MSFLLQERWLRLAGITHADRGSAPIIIESTGQDAVADLSISADEDILGIDSDEIWEAGLNCELSDQCKLDLDPATIPEEEV